MNNSPKCIVANTYFWLYSIFVIILLYNYNTLYLCVQIWNQFYSEPFMVHIQKLDSADKNGLTRLIHSGLLTLDNRYDNIYKKIGLGRNGAAKRVVIRYICTFFLAYLTISNGGAMFIINLANSHLVFISSVLNSTYHKHA